MRIDQYAASREGYLRGAVGCKMSHLQVIRHGKEHGMQRILILEDDACFKDNALGIFSNIVRKLPADWHMLYFGGQHIKRPRWYRRHLRRIRAYFTTHAYGINLRFADLILDNALESGKEIDVFLAENVHPLKRSFATHPNLATQRAGYSDILETEMDYQSVIS